MDGRVDAGDTKAMRGKDILQELGVPSSDIELLLADPDGKTRSKISAIEERLVAFFRWSSHG